MRPNLWESCIERAQGRVAPEGKTHTAQGPCSPAPGQLLPRTSAPKHKPLRSIASDWGVGTWVCAQLPGVGVGGWCGLFRAASLAHP